MPESCEYCKDNQMLDPVWSITPFGTEDKRWVEFNFCPVCGRSLVRPEPLTVNELYEVKLGEPLFVASTHNFQYEGKWAIPYGKTGDREQFMLECYGGKVIFSDQLKDINIYLHRPSKLH